MRKIGKLEKFAQNKESANVLEEGKPIYDTVKGNWNQFFGNENGLVLELACGWGEYTLALAEKFPGRNFVGVDLKGDRIWRGSQQAIRLGLSNVAFLRMHISHLADLFEENEVSEIWLTFPDPRPKDRDEKHRLSNESYLKMYAQILKPEGWFKFKTDNTALFEYTLEVLSDFKPANHAFTFDLYHSDLLADHYGIETKYERIWVQRGERIKYMKFQFEA